MQRTKKTSRNPFNSLFSRTTWVSRHKKGLTNLDFYSMPQCSHCKHCASSGNSIRPFVHLSVCHTPVLCQKTAHSTVQFAQSDSKMCLVLWKPKTYSPGTTPSPWNLGSYWPTPPDNSESWYILPCSASTVRASDKSSIMMNRKSYTNFPMSHQPRFYTAPNFLKMWIKYLNLSSFIQFWQQKTRSLLQSFTV